MKNEGASSSLCNEKTCKYHIQPDKKQNRVCNDTEQIGSINNNITYAGYQYDSESGLYYLNARMYDPKTARFLQEGSYRGDPNDPLSLNLYTYCHNEPLMYSDPTGHKWMDQGGKDKPKKEQKEKKETKAQPKKQEKKSIVDKLKDKAKQVKDAVKEALTGKGKDNGPQKAADKGKQATADKSQGNVKNAAAKPDGSKQSVPKAAKTDNKPSGGGTNQQKSSDKLNTKGTCNSSKETSETNSATVILKNNIKDGISDLKFVAKTAPLAMAVPIVKEYVSYQVEDKIGKLQIKNNSAGNPVVRKLVKDQDELLSEAERAAGGSLDDFTEIKPNWYQSADGKRRIEWNTEGHANTNEGPRVTVRDFDGKRHSVVEKIFIEGWEEFKRIIGNK